MWQYNIELYHHGILGQRWGIRRYQNEDGTLTEAGRKRLEKKDARWARRNYNRILKTANKATKKELKSYKKELLKDPNAKNSNGKISAHTINLYNRKMADLMNTKVTDITAPSGKVVRFVAKRGEIGVHIALADNGYDIQSLKNGIWANGRIAYKQKVLDKI